MQTEQSSESETRQPALARIPRQYLVYASLALIAVIILASLAAELSVRRSADSSEAVSNAGEEAPAIAADTGITPRPTELPAVAEPALPAITPDLRLPEPTATIQAVALPLPTATPTPVPPPLAPREIEISGATTIRLALSGEGFDSTGRPLSFQIEPRKIALGGDIDTASDSWCLQLGLVNEAFDLSVRLDRETEELFVSGFIALREGFCEQPGEEMDRAEVELSVPTDAAAQISYNLRGQRSLFGLSGVLDSDTGAIVELRVANTGPE